MNKLICGVHSNYLPNGEVFDSGRSLHFDFLEHYFGSNYEVLRHSLYGGGESRVYKKGINGKYSKMPLIASLPGPLRYISEVVFNIIYLVVNWRKKIVFYGVDPLSSFSACLLKKMGFNIQVFFLNPDYSERRFDNLFLNKSYFFLDRFCTKNCDKNICNSIFVIRKKMKDYGLEKENFFHMPNIPNPWIIEKYKKNAKIKNRIVYVGLVSTQIDFKSLFNSLAELNKKTALSLVIVGSGDIEENLKTYAKDRKLGFVTFLGNVSHERALSEISRAEIGIAVYNGSLNYDKFRDSCKIREYQALGAIPVATDAVLSNTKEIKKYGSGIIVNGQEELRNALEKISSSDVLKEQLRFHCKRNNEIYKQKFNELNKMLAT
jgi:glycosyltransferase involved in cell wall biosynthesis